MYKDNEIPIMILIIIKYNDDTTILLLFHLMNNKFNNLIALVNCLKLILNNIQLCLK